MSAAVKATPVRVVLEVGSKRTFASAIDWPGWSRSGKTAELALESLAAYADRYRAAIGTAKLSPAFPKTFAFDVVETVAGNATTDFGAPGVIATFQESPLSPTEAKQRAAVLRATWAFLEQVAAAAPEALAKGPRGGGRDTSKILEHVNDAEKAYARKLGVSTKGITDIRPLILDAIESNDATTWPARYAASRIAWHVLDHAWEIQDKS